LVAYFAYGANLAEAVMAEHCPRHVLVGVAELPGHRFAFTRRSVRTGTGVADVVSDPESSVWGVVYELDDLAALDAKEGAGWAYERTEVTVRVADVERRAITYKVKHPEPVAIPPSETYVAGVVEAARARGLPAAYVSDLERIAAAAASSSGRPA
jgi:hypothetical protein